MSISDIRKDAIDGLMVNIAEINKTEIRKVNQTISELMREGDWDSYISFHKKLHDIFMEYCLDDAPEAPSLDISFDEKNKVVAYMTELNRYAIKTISVVNTAFIKAREISLMIECRNKLLSACMDALKSEEYPRKNKTDIDNSNELEEKPKETAE